MSHIPLPLGILFSGAGEEAKKKSLAIFHFYKNIICENKNNK